MRTLVQPGLADPRRIDSFAGTARRLTFDARAGVSLLEALTAPIVAAGFQSAVLRFAGAAMAPFRYVIPAVADDGAHVAYFSETHAPAGPVAIEQAAATFGWHLGRPFLHCHAIWIEPDGARRGGHILNDESISRGGIAVEAWGFETLRIETREDTETNFPLFQPSRAAPDDGHAVLARIKPNEDILSAIEATARAHGIRNATIAGSLGSLVGTHFEDGRVVPGDATEVLVRSGSVRNGMAALDVASVDMAGHVHEGRLKSGENPVCITFDLVLL